MSDTATGLDRRHGVIFSAAIEVDAGRVTITGLRRFSNASDDGPVWSEVGRVRLAIPESLAIVKPIVIEAGDADTRHERVLFEMAASMLDDEEQFLTATQATGNDCRYIGMILRRALAQEVCESFGGGSESDLDHLSFQLRAVGLGRGYLAFCRKEEAELVGLVDLAGGAASICLVHGNDIVDVASLATDAFDLTSEADREQFAVDLKTVINYRQVALTEAGITVPLSSLLLVGDMIDDDFRRIVLKYFPAGVRTPEVHDGFLTGDQSESADSLPLFLVALGLAVN